mmetsp:Transcript_16765/g.50248  ORF Transcript_16765/g.50248 Transcript_16765/m.50248 type:complete len:81 (-) Transcript_16765:32-274(-)
MPHGCHVPCMACRVDVMFPLPTQAWRQRFSCRPAANSAAAVPVTRPFPAFVTSVKRHNASDRDPRIGSSPCSRPGHAVKN